MSSAAPCCSLSSAFSRPPPRPHRRRREALRWLRPPRPPPLPARPQLPLPPRKRPRRRSAKRCASSSTKVRRCSCRQRSAPGSPACPWPRRSPPGAPSRRRTPFRRLPATSWRAASSSGGASSGARGCRCAMRADCCCSCAARRASASRSIAATPFVRSRSGATARSKARRVLCSTARVPTPSLPCGGPPTRSACSTCPRWSTTSSSGKSCGG